MSFSENEMRGLLTGKCIPGDMKVNEELPSYLVRKFDALQEQVQQLAAEGVQLKAIVDGVNSELYGQGFEVAGWHLNGELEPLDSWFTDNGWGTPETPATDAVIREIGAKAVDQAVRKLQGIGDNSYASYELECLAKTIRAGEKP